MTERDITICGHGSNVPSLKNLYQYNEMRYNGKMSNGVRKQLLRVLVLRQLLLLRRLWWLRRLWRLR